MGNVSRRGAIILVGGHGSRIGADKSRLKLGSETFLERLVRLIAPRVGRTLLAGRSDQAADFSGDFEFVPDEIENAGPLAGLVAGLRALESSSETAFVIAVDTPLLHPGLIELLNEKIGNHVAAIPYDGLHWYGLTAVYRTDAWIRIGNLLEQGVRRVRDLPEHVPVVAVSMDEIREVDRQLDSLFNVNSASQYAELVVRFMAERG